MSSVLQLKKVELENVPLPTHYVSIYGKPLELQIPMGNGQYRKERLVLSDVHLRSLRDALLELYPLEGTVNASEQGSTK